MKTVYRLRNIDFAYADKQVLHIDEYTITEHSVTALVGANGCGKSTLLNLLAFITRPVSGELFFFGRPALKASPLDFRREIAYLQQKPYLFNMSVRANIELGLKLRGIEKQQRADSLEKIAGKLKIEPLLAKRAHQLSGGETQKVALARALVLQAKVLLLDEPFSYLDRQSREDMEELLRSIAASREQTVIFTTHNQVQAQDLADEIYCLEQGDVRQGLLLNTFSGELDPIAGLFRTAHLEIHVPSSYTGGTQLAIESTHLVLSNKPLESSMRNQFRGRVVALQEKNGEINITVDAGETWQVMISREALAELGIHIGAQIWLSFKSTAVQVF